jgi:hypothetical protein
LNYRLKKSKIKMFLILCIDENDRWHARKNTTMGMVDRIGKGWLGTASLVIFFIFIALPAALAGWNQPLRASR